MSCSLSTHPARAPDEQLDGIAEPAVADPSARRSSRRQTRTGAMSCTGRPVRRRSQARTTAFPGPGVPRPHPARGGPSRPRAIVARPERTSSRRGSNPRGSIEPSPSSTATNCAVANSIPRCTAAPYPSWNSCTTRAPAPGDVGGAVSRAVVDNDDPHASRHPPQHTGQGRRLVTAGDHEVAVQVHTATLASVIHHASATAE